MKLVFEDVLNELEYSLIVINFELYGNQIRLCEQNVLAREPSSATYNEKLDKHLFINDR